MEKLTDFQKKAIARKKAFQGLFDAMIKQFGIENVTQVGDNEIAVIVDYASEGVPIWATFKPIIKEFKFKTTAKNKTVDAYDGFFEADAYEVEAKEKAEKEAEKERLKQLKIERDKKAREREKQVKEERAKLNK